MLYKLEIIMEKDKRLIALNIRGYQNYGLVENNSSKLKKLFKDSDMKFYSLIIKEYLNFIFVWNDKISIGNE